MAIRKINSHLDRAAGRKTHKIGVAALAALTWALAAGGLAAASPDSELPKIAGVDTSLVADSVARYISESATPDSKGSGPYPAIKHEVSSLPDHVVYEPAELAALGALKMPVYVFGNGACSEDGSSQRQHLLEIASHGYLVISAGRIYSGAGSELTAEDWFAHRDKTSYRLLGSAVDWAIAENVRQGSPYEGRIDTAHIAMSGYSCGGAQALRYAADPRVSTFVIMNAGISEMNTPLTGEMGVSPEVIDQIEVPTLYVLGGPTDVAYTHGMADFARLSGTPAAAINIDVTHQGTYAEPNGGAAAQAVVAWLQWQLRGDEVAAQWFKGDECRLCTDPRWTLERKDMEPPAN